MSSARSEADTAQTDAAFMRAALALARRGLGNVWPNPAVGCVIVKNGRVGGRGWTRRGGRPHAETEALGRTGTAAEGATAYVTLEPCAHHGKTPPCAEALVAAGLRRVVVALEDPDPRVCGRGIARLRKAGIKVETGVCAAEAAELNAGFFTRLEKGRPLVTLKLAASLDGRIATASGESRWITGDAARERVHLLRATHDAILVGTDTVIADDPELTCRLPGLGGHSPLRVVLDRRRRIPKTAKVFDTRLAPTWLVTAAADRADTPALSEHGIELVEIGGDTAGALDLAAVLGALGKGGITRLLVEGGGRLAAALLRESLVDRLVWFHAPLLIGGDGMSALAPFRLGALAEAPRFERVGSEAVGVDVMTTFRLGGPR